jgi:nucleotide-binding universal stress UspA family protein
MPPLFRSILVPLDGSAQAEQVLPWVKRHAVPSKAEVVLLQVLQMEYPLKGLPFPKGVPEARRYLQGIERELNFEGIPTEIILRGNSVAAEIVKTAWSERCDLIAMTTGHTSKTVRWLFGGITELVLRLSPIPVFILRNGIGDRLRIRPRSIVVPLDGSSHSRTALPLAEGLARFHRVPLVLLHVVDHAAGSARANARKPDALKRLSRICDGLKKRKVRAVVRVESGDAAAQIAASVLPSDLLAMTTHGRGGLKRLFLGSVAERVMQQAACPVLVVKESRP